MEKTEIEKMQPINSDLELELEQEQGNEESKVQTRIIWRRSKINELLIKGYSQSQIVRELNLSKATVSRDCTFLEEQANKTIKNHINKTLPYQYDKCLQGLDQIIFYAWTIADSSKDKEDTKTKLASLSLIKDTYQTKMDLLTNASLLEDSIKFVQLHRHRHQGREDKLHSNQEEESEKIDIQGPGEVNEAIF